MSELHEVFFFFFVKLACLSNWDQCKSEIVFFNPNATSLWESSNEKKKKLILKGFEYFWDLIER